MLAAPAEKPAVNELSGRWSAPPIGSGPETCLFFASELQLQFPFIKDYISATDGSRILTFYAAKKSKIIYFLIICTFSFAVDGVFRIFMLSGIVRKRKQHFFNATEPKPNFCLQSFPL